MFPHFRLACHCVIGVVVDLDLAVVVVDVVFALWNHCLFARYMLSVSQYMLPHARRQQQFVPHSLAVSCAVVVVDCNYESGAEMLRRYWDKDSRQLLSPGTGPDGVKQIPWFALSTRNQHWVH